MSSWEDHSRSTSGQDGGWEARKEVLVTGAGVRAPSESPTAA